MTCPRPERAGTPALFFHRIRFFMPENALRVLHCVISLDVGGLERIVVDLARTSLSRGNEVSILCLERPGTLATELVAMGVRVNSLNKPPGITPELVGRAKALLAELKPDVIHSHQVGVLWYVGRAASELGIPVLHTEHIDNVLKARGIPAKIKCRILWRRAGKFANLFCCVSADISASASRWGTVPKSKLRVVLNGIDANVFSRFGNSDSLRGSLGIAEDRFVIGSVGRLNEVKRQDLLIEALATLRSRYPKLVLLLVGDGPERQNLEVLAKELGVADHVVFAGYQWAPQKFLACMNLFALSSRLEGLPLAMLEAWAAGLPVVSSDVGGIPKVLRHGVNGLMFPSGNVPKLAEAIEQLLTSPDTAKALGEAGRATVLESYTLDRMAEQYERYYREIMALKGGS